MCMCIVSVCNIYTTEKGQQVFELVCVCVCVHVFANVCVFACVCVCKCFMYLVLVSQVICTTIYNKVITTMLHNQMRVVS